MKKDKIFLTKLIGVFSLFIILFYPTYGHLASRFNAPDSYYSHGFLIPFVFAWLIWIFVHIRFLIEFDNKLLVLIQWAWNYFTRKRGARLITGKDPFPLIETLKDENIQSLFSAPFEEEQPSTSQDTPPNLEFPIRSS